VLLEATLDTLNDFTPGYHFIVEFDFDFELGMDRMRQGDILLLFY
jgi:hypothetical protein